MSEKQAGDWFDVDPAFDGHLEKSLLDMSPDQRLDWIWQMMQLLHWAKKERERAEVDSTEHDPIREAE